MSSMTPAQARKAQLQKLLAQRVLARRRLLQFTQMTHPAYSAGWVHDDICRRLERFSQEVAEKKSPRLMLLMPPRQGKLLADDTMVLTSEGWKTHGDLVKGDKVMGLKGWTEVIGVSRPGVADCEVTTNAGTRIRCHRHHEWGVEEYVYRSDKRSYSYNVIETLDLLAHKAKNGHMRGAGAPTMRRFYLPSPEFTVYDLSVRRMLQYRRNPRNGGRLAIEDVTELEEPVPGKCIQVAAEDGIYLVTRDFVPTHNSELASIRFPAWHLGHNPTHEIINVGYNLELPMRFSRKVREVMRDPQYKAIFPDSQLDPDSQSVEAWNTTKGGGFTAAGVGGGITGKGAHILIIDDPIKNQEEADSILVRDKLWDWYQSCFVAGTPVRMADGTWRPVEEVAPGDKVASFDAVKGRMTSGTVIATGSQPVGPTYMVRTRYGLVRCSGEHPFFVLPVSRTGRYLGIKRGRWVPAAELKRGDIVLTDLTGARAGTGAKRSDYNAEFWWLAGFILGDGFFDDSTIHIACGIDESLNARVQALCQKYFGAGTRYIRGRVNEVRVCRMAAVRLLQNIGLSRVRAPQKRVPTRVFSLPVTLREAFIQGYLSADGHRMGKNRWTLGCASRELVQDLLLLAKSTGYLCSPSVGARYFTAQPPGSPAPVDAVAYYAHVRRKRLGFYGARVLEAGRVEDAVTYNLEVEGTGTFVADGFVVHNTAYTRLAPGGGVLCIETFWNDDDLAGRLQQAMSAEDEADQFKIIKYPALSEHWEYRDELTNEILRLDAEIENLAPNITLLRPKDTCLHEDRYPTEALKRIRANLQPRIWSALYQQNPVPDEGMYFKKEYFRYQKALPSPNGLRIYTAWDFAIGEKQQNDWTVGATVLQDETDTIYVLEIFRMKGDSFQIVEAMLDVALRWGSIPTTGYLMGAEDGQIWRAIEPLLKKRMGERRQYPPYEVMRPMTDKLARARPLQGRMQQGRVVFPEGAGWLPQAEQELLRFPAGVHDDVVDALAWAAQLCMGKEPPRLAVPPPLPSWRDKLSIVGGQGSYMSA